MCIGIRLEKLSQKKVLADHPQMLLLCLNFQNDPLASLLEGLFVKSRSNNHFSQKIQSTHEVLSWGASEEINSVPFDPKVQVRIQFLQSPLNLDLPKIFALFKDHQSGQVSDPPLLDGIECSSVFDHQNEGYSLVVTG